MKITADTNVLVRAAVLDEPVQAQLASQLFGTEEHIAISLPCLCEFAWVLKRAYRFKNPQIAFAIEQLLESDNIGIERAAVEEGLKVLRSGGDFADGVLAYEGRRLGGETFVSFDKEAVKLLARQGYETQLLS